MAEKFYYFIRVTLGNLSPEKLLFICLLATTGAFVLCIVLCLFLPKYSFTKRLWLVGFYFSILIFQSAHTLIFGHSFAYPLFTASFCVFFCLPSFFISTKKIKLKKEQKELADFLDRTAFQLKNQTQNSIEEVAPLDQQAFCKELPPKTNVPIEKLVASPKPVLKEEMPDFSHVKNVMERLAYFPLTPFDKRQVKELEVAMKRIENGENTSEAKNKINDGLSSLLKIMSKYGV
jgi:hypothetical protein